MTVEHRVILKRTSSAVRPHPRGPAPESLAVSRSRSPARRHSKPPDSGRTRCTAAAGEPGVLGGGGSPLLKPMDPHVRRRRRFLASTVLTFLVTLWMVNAHSFLTDTTGRFRSSVGSAAGNRPGNDGRMLRGEYESKAGAGAVATTTTAAAALDDPALTAGKEPILQLLRDAGVTNQLDTDTLAALPTWQQVTDLYGSQPVLHGLDTCPTFRASSDPAEHLLGVAGTFNTGTNLLAELLIQNCEMPARMAKYGAVNKGIRWQVPWGKHTPVDDENVRQGHKTKSAQALEADAVFPAVTIRSPAVWAASMCRHSYEMNWTHIHPTDKDGNGKHLPQHCPNFVPNEIDIGLNETLKDAKSVPVSIQYAEFIRTHDSLLHHWNDYYRAYYDAPFPRAIVRYEDLIFFPKQVTEAVCTCAGGTLQNKGQHFQYVVESAKKGAAHGSEKTGYLNAIIRYGNDMGQWEQGGMTDADRTFATEHLDRQLIKLFGYKFPEQGTRNSGFTKPQ